MSDMPYVSATVSEWQPMDTAPWGAKCLLLTRLGMCIVGVAVRSQTYDAWAPLPKRPQWLKDMQHGR